MQITHPDLIYLRKRLFWNLWAFGVTRFSRRSPEPYPNMRCDIVTFAFGPLRFQFLDWSTRWAK